jgi:hypothetical protein
MDPKKTIFMLLAVLVITLAIGAARSLADDVDLKSFLVGKWHQEVGDFVGDTVFNSDGTFTSLASKKGTSYHEGVKGHWQIRNENELWQHNEDCSPNDCAAEWDGTWIKVIDNDHIQNKLGDAYRQ